MKDYTSTLAVIATFFGIWWKTRSDQNQEKARKAAELRIQYHDDRLTAISEVTTVVMETRDAAIRAVEHKQSVNHDANALMRHGADPEDLDDDDFPAHKLFKAKIEELHSLSLKVQVSAERYGKVLGSGDYLSDTLRAWHRKMLISAVNFMKSTIEQQADEAIHLCRQLAQIEREAKEDQVSMLSPTKRQKKTSP